METFLLLLIAQLVCLTSGHPGGSEFGRRRTTMDDPRRNRLFVLEYVAERRHKQQQKSMDWSLEESLTDIFDVHRATLELSMSFSWSMSMSGPHLPVRPSNTPSGPPIVLTASPIGTSPTGPSGTPRPSATLKPSSGPAGPSGIPRPSATIKPSSGPAGPSGTPRPSATLKPSSGPAGPSGTPRPSRTLKPYSGPAGPPGPPRPLFTPKPSTILGPRPLAPSGPPRFSGSLNPATTPVFIPSAPPIFSNPPQTGEPSISPNTIDPFVPPSMSPNSLPLPAITPDPMIVPTSTPSKEPTTEPSSSGLQKGITDCQSTNSLQLGTAADERSTPVAIDISYSAESNNSFIEEFETELVDEFIRTAVFAIFGCNPETRQMIAPNTEEITNATCDPTMDGGNECFVLQTTFIIGVEGPVDTDSAAYLVYKAIQENMNNGTYVEAVDDLVFVEFLSPLPLIKPPSSGGGNSSPDGIDSPRAGRDVDVNPWTIGFSVASVMGGFVSLLVYARAKRSRQGHLLEDTTPWVNPENDTVI